jgi:hypothetical protein
MAVVLGRSWSEGLEGPGNTASVARWPLSRLLSSNVAVFKAEWQCTFVAVKVAVKVFGRENSFNMAFLKLDLKN